MLGCALLSMEDNFLWRDADCTSKMGAICLRSRLIIFIFQLQFRVLFKMKGLLLVFVLFLETVNWTEMTSDEFDSYSMFITYTAVSW